jgi:SAM-dependent methyltransferase
LPGGSAEPLAGRLVEGQQSLSVKGQTRAYRARLGSLPAVRRVWECVRRPYSRARLTLGIAALSERWGSDRGTPLHRLYVARFLEEHRASIAGRCLEFNDPGYLERFGGPRVTSIDIIHIDDTNPRATVVADLTGDNAIPSSAFDCIICIHVLHVVGDLGRFVRELHRILAPGGAVLVAVPQVSMNDPEQGELWRFTAEGLARTLAVAFPPERTRITAFGNSLTSAGEIRGLVAEDFFESELQTQDVRFALELCAIAGK